MDTFIQSYIEEASNSIVTQIRHAIGVRQLNANGNRGDIYGSQYYPSNELRTFLLKGMPDAKAQQNVEYMLSALEMMCQVLKEGYARNIPWTVEQINYRLRLGGVGYKFAGGMLIPVDDENLTNSAVIPLVSLLNQPEFLPAYKYLAQSFNDYKSSAPKALLQLSIMLKKLSKHF